MRMWMVDPKRMCRQHLLGEHAECHMFAGCMRRGFSLQGYIDNNLFEPVSLKQRHDELSIEIKRRGYNHKTPLPKLRMSPYTKLLGARIDRKASKADLLSRCGECEKLHRG